MNRRIKKKVDKRLHSGITVKTYREIKNERKAFRETMTNCMHVASKLIDYSHQLLNSRRLRKAWKHEFFN